jgi:hypothetical protein
MSRPAWNLKLVQQHEDRPHRISVGDIVRSGDNRYPHYHVIATNGDRAWVRDVQYGTDHVVGIESVHRV